MNLLYNFYIKPYIENQFVKNREAGAGEFLFFRAKDDCKEIITRSQIHDILQFGEARRKVWVERSIGHSDVTIL